jgi:hypothetical protein
MIKSRLAMVLIPALAFVVGTRAPSTGVLIVQTGDAATGAFIADAQVRLSSVGRTERTRWNGETSFGGLANGRYHVEVRAIGYAPGDLDVQMTGDTVALHFDLERLSVQLDTVRVRGEATVRYLKEFDARRKLGIGRFFTDSVLTAHREQGLRMFLSSRVPGLVVWGNGVLARRGFKDLKAYKELCAVLFHIDGHVFTPPPAGAVHDGRLQTVRDTQTVDLDEFRMEDFAAIEVYMRAEAPPQYRPLGDYCTVVLLWSKW